MSAGEDTTAVPPQGEGTSIGVLLRDWRRRRRLSQLDLALEAGVSARHVSFVETGRSRPSPEMVLGLAEELEVPLRERNRLLLAAGYAPRFEQHELGDEEMRPLRSTLERILAGHEPYPAVVVDGAWEMIAANRAVALLTAGAAAHLLEPPINVLRLALHPEGMAPRIANFREWRDHLIGRLDRQIALTASPALRSLGEELREYSPDLPGERPPEGPGLAVPLRLRTEAGELSLISTVTTFGTAVEVTASELSVESFFPLDEATASILRNAAAEPPRA